jgi:hypothetical protein
MFTDTLIDFYKVRDSNQPLKLAVKISNKVNADSTIMLSRQMIRGDGRDGSFAGSFELVLGMNKDLQGKELRLTTLVHDILSTIKTTTLTVSLDGGGGRYIRTLDVEPSENGGIITYSVSIRFYK